MIGGVSKRRESGEEEGATAATGKRKESKQQS